MKLKPLLVFGTILAALAMLGYVRAAGQRPPGYQGPRILVEPEEWDFGQVRQPTVVTHNFTVRNAGQETLEIRRVSTSCGCTSAKIDKGIIGPGGEATLVVTYDSGAMKYEKGQVEKIVYLRSNDLENPQVEVTIYAHVE